MIKNKIENYIQNKLEENKNDIEFESIEEFKKHLNYRYFIKSKELLTYQIYKVNPKRNKTNKQAIRDYDNNSIIDKSNFKISDDGFFKIEENFKGQTLNTHYKNKNTKNISKVYYLDYKNRNKTKLFATFTLTSEYQYFISSKKFIKNEKCEYKFKQSIELGLKKLNEIHEYFYKNIKKKASRANLDTKLDFIKIIEPHKNCQGHLHCLLWLDDELIPIVKKCFEMTKKKFNLVRVELDDNVENSLIEQNISKTATYISKYLLKSLRGDNNFFNKYQNYFSNIRFFTGSDYEHTNQTELNQIYKFYKENYPELLENAKSKGIPVYVFLEDEIKQGKFKFDYETKTSTMIDYKKLDNDIAKLKETQLDESEKKELLLQNINKYLLHKKVKTLKQITSNENKDVFYESGIYDNTSLTIEDINKIFFENMISFKNKKQRVEKSFYRKFQNLKYIFFNFFDTLNIKKSTAVYA